MTDRVKNKLSYANVAATLALVLVIGGGTFAVSAVVEDGEIKACYDKKGSNQGEVRLLVKGKCEKSEKKVAWNQKGEPGAPGADGADGAPGPSQAVTTSLGDLELTESGQVASLDLTAGSWVIFARLGSVHNDIDTPARLECLMIGPGATELDFSKLRLPPNDNGLTALVFEDVTMQGATTLTEAGTVTVSCSIVGVGEDTGFTFTMREMTAIRVGSLATQ